MGKSSNICFRVEEETVEELDKIGEQSYRSRSNLLYMAVNKVINYYNKYGTLEGFMQE